MIYSVVANKGGVGKTTFCTNVVAILSQKKKAKTLLIDMDAQANCSIAFGLNPKDHKKNVYEVLLRSVPAEDAIIKIYKNLFFLPAHYDLNFLEKDVYENKERYPNPYLLLTKSIENIRDKYDYIFIDTPPSLDLRVSNALVCCDKVIIPVEPDSYAVKGLAAEIQAINDCRNINKNLQIAGVVGMQVDKRMSLHNDMMQEIRRYLHKHKIRIFDTVIPRTVRFASSVAYEKKPAVLVHKKNELVNAYYALVKEMFE